MSAAGRPLRVLMALTYYVPHVSGLTIYVQRLARALVRRGHQVTVLTSHYDPALPLREEIEGVEVQRVPVMARVEKGVAMPLLPAWGQSLVQRSDVVHIHLPQLEAGVVATMARANGKHTIITHHCDLELPPGGVNALAGPISEFSHRVAGRVADRIITYTQDYANHSRFLRRFADRVKPVLPPVEMRRVAPEEIERFRQEHRLRRRPLIGFAARIAREKGVDHLLRALPLVAREFPDVQLALAGEYERVLGEKTFQEIQPLIEAQKERVHFAGNLSQHAIAAFFGACDVLTVPSVNQTESFGLVQIEAMLSGTPVVASNLPGVRQPVRLTGCGEIAAIGDHADLAEKLIKVLRNPERYQPDRAKIERQFDPEATVAAYERIYRTQD